MSTKTSPELTIELKTHGFELPEAEYSSIETRLHTLREAVETFPLKSLTITMVYHPRHNNYHVKMSLVLSGRKLFTGERDRSVHPAIERCIDKLLRKISSAKLQMHSDAELTKQAAGTHHILESTLDFDTKELEEACFFQDYRRFRNGLDGFEPCLSNRIGRWVQRYPELEEQLSGWLTISDLVEDVFFHAYEHFGERNPEVPPGAWLESLIDPTLQELLHHPKTEYANICYAQDRLKNHPD